MNIRIASVPPGEAPEEVRAAWVGLSLPVTTPKPRTVRTHGVRSGPRNALALFLATLVGGGRRERGYLVDAAAAIDLLGRHSPEAAAWWREHAPHLLGISPVEIGRRK